MGYPRLGRTTEKIRKDAHPVASSTGTTRPTTKVSPSSQTCRTCLPRKKKSEWSRRYSLRNDTDHLQRIFCPASTKRFRAALCGILARVVKSYTRYHRNLQCTYGSLKVGL